MGDAFISLCFPVWLKSVLDLWKEKKYRSCTWMRQIDKKCHNDDADDDEDYDVSKNDDDEELMMVVMINNKDKLRSDRKVAD